jgi:hypothetical protein
MMRCFALLLSVLSVAGCVRMVWTKEDFTEQEFRVDAYACERDVRQSGYFGTGGEAAGNAQGFYRRCMESKGYRRVQESELQAQPSSPPASTPRMARGTPPAPTAQPADLRCPGNTFWNGSGCTSSAVARPPAAIASVGGTYAGRISGIQAGRSFALTVTFTIVQQGAGVLGTWTTSGGTSGTATGQVTGSQIADFLATQLSPCPGVLRGTVAIEEAGALLRGTYSGEGCGAPISASFVVNRQP